MISGTLETQVARFLFNYRIIPQTTTGVSPSELLFDHHLRTLSLRFFMSKLRCQGLSKPVLTEKFHDFHDKDRQLIEGVSVLVKNFSAIHSWSQESYTPRLVPL